MTKAWVYSEDKMWPTNVCNFGDPLMATHMCCDTHVDKRLNILVIGRIQSQQSKSKFVLIYSNYFFWVPSQLQCCGLDQGYQDWGYNISESCLCLQDSTNPCVSIKATLGVVWHDLQKVRINRRFVISTKQLKSKLHTSITVTCTPLVERHLLLFVSHWTNDSCLCVL